MGLAWFMLSLLSTLLFLYVVPFDWFWAMIGLCFGMLVLLPYYLYSVFLPADYFYLVFCVHLVLLGLYLLWRPKHNPRFRKLPLWSYFLDHYFGFSLEGPGAHLLAKQTADPSKTFVFAAHPHGLYACYSSFFLLNPSLLHVRGATTSLQMYIPLVKELVCMAGAIPANRGDILSTLACGESVFLTPGGLREILHRQETYKKHHGFLRVAKGANVPVVPIYVAGVKQLYSVYLLWPWLQSLLLSLLLYPGFVPSKGAWWLPFWPRKPTGGLTLWVGEPMWVGDNVEEAASEFYEQMDRLEKLSK